MKFRSGKINRRGYLTGTVNIASLEAHNFGDGKKAMTATTTQSGETRSGPGRPRIYPRGRINASVRVTPTRYAALRAAALASGRSMSEELEHRIEKCAAYEEMLTAMRRGDLLLADAPAKQSENVEA